MKTYFLYENPFLRSYKFYETPLPDLTTDFTFGECFFFHPSFILRLVVGIHDSNFLTTTTTVYLSVLICVHFSWISGKITPDPKKY